MFIDTYFERISDIVVYLSDVYELLKKASFILAEVFLPLVEQVKEEGGDNFDIEATHIFEFKQVLSCDSFLKCVLTAIKNRGKDFRELHNRIEAIEEEIGQTETAEAELDIDDLVEMIEEPSSKEKKKLDEEVNAFKERLKEDSVASEEVYKLKLELDENWIKDLYRLNK